MDTSVNGAHRTPSLASQRHVTYSCGACGYDLSLCSSNRNITTVGSKYGKSIKRGIISFFQIDESRFTQVDEIQCCIPYLNSKNSWGLFRKKTKLLCRKCGNRIGNSYENCYVLEKTESDDHIGANKEVIGCRKYEIRIRALQPSSAADQLGTPLFA